VLLECSRFIIFTHAWLLKENARNVLSFRKFRSLQLITASWFLSKAFFDLAKEAEKNIPGDSNLSTLLPQVFELCYFSTNSFPEPVCFTWKGVIMT
jgi:hypothetical protein